jgi:hypothetical protein
MPTKNTPDTRYLTCSCCGEGTRGRQWHNRDTGYGLCPSCAVRLAALPHIGHEDTAAYMRDCYGIAGVHYFTVTA